MSYKQKCKQNLVIGKQVTLILDGLQYTGEVIEADFMNPVDAHVSIKDEDGVMYHIPVSSKFIISVEPDEADDEVEDEPVAEKPKTNRKRKTSTKKTQAEK